MIKTGENVRSPQQQQTRRANIRPMRKAWMLAVLPLALVVGCGSSGSAKAAPRAQPTPTETYPLANVDHSKATLPPEPSLSVSPTPSPSPTNPYAQFNLPAGYPQIVAKSTVDYRFANGLHTDPVLNVWPGVYMDMAPGASIADDIANGSTIGYCASIKAFQAASGNSVGFTCW